MRINKETDLTIAKIFLSVDLRLLALAGVIMGSDHQTFIVVLRSDKSFWIIIAKFFTNSISTDASTIYLA